MSAPRPLTAERLVLRLRDVAEGVANGQVRQTPLQPLLREAADRIEALTEALEDTLVWLAEGKDLVAELAGDLKHNYEPEKGWPPHIEHAANFDGDATQMIVDAREALAGGVRA